MHCLKKMIVHHHNQKIVKDHLNSVQEEGILHDGKLGGNWNSVHKRHDRRDEPFEKSVDERLLSISPPELGLVVFFGFGFEFGAEKKLPVDVFRFRYHDGRPRQKRWRTLEFIAFGDWVNKNMFSCSPDPENRFRRSI